MYPSSQLKELLPRAEDALPSWAKCCLPKGHMLISLAHFLETSHTAQPLDFLLCPCPSFLPATLA